MSDVVIVGGGLAGLACAGHLNEAGIGCQIFEAADQVGGRARTDELNGFLLDRGFQVLLTAYPEAQRRLDFSGFSLSRFEPGALVRYGGRFRRFVDPWRRPQHLFASALSPAATFGDKFRVARLRNRLRSQSLDAIFEKPETTTREALDSEGFSSTIIERFFRPFLGGVFLESDLDTSSRMFEFVFKMFATGDAALPARGMGALAAQLARRLPAGAIQTNTPVQSVEPTAVYLENGQRIAADAVVVACYGPSAAQLFDEAGSPQGQDVTCLYYAADFAPIKEPILVLNGEGEGP
ncbi:MAG: FAD-dependent oxidoreductase, partial [Planctomycetota bacterium]